MTFIHSKQIPEKESEREREREREREEERGGRGKIRFIIRNGVSK